MKRNIAIIAGLIVVLGVLFATASPATDSATGEKKSLFSGLSFGFGSRVPDLNDSFTVTSAWGVFQDYLKFAQNNDIDGVKSLSYQVSETCSNPKKVEDCKILMNSVYLIAEGFKLEDFKNVSYDDRQIIMSTDYMKIAEDTDDTKVVLYFVRSDRGEPKVLGIRFCYGAESEDQKCVITDPETRDADKDGWWDDIEVLFKNK
jgi:hypothetical protein